MSYFSRFLNRSVVSLTTVGICLFIGMMLAIVANVILRAFGEPILGVHEAVGIMMVVTVAFAIGYCALLQSHIVINIVITHVRPSIRRILAIITTFLSLIIWALIAWQSAVFGWEQSLKNETTHIMEWPLYPFRYVFAFGLLILCVVLIIDLINLLRKSSRNGTG